MSNKRKQILDEKANSKRSRKSDNDSDVDIIFRKKGRAGRVLRIYLRNFMCHTSLEINLDPNTNYIIGRNGSGKSAILTALTIGLGGKAKLTNRGANIKSFIKVGQSTATVEITLSNTGPMAFNPQVYGEEITIVRSFTDTGGNKYKLKSANGHIITTAFRELNRLIDTLNIHVDNPVCILNQDVARTFLNSNDPEKHYIMFMKATNLESVKLQYKISLKNKKEAQVNLQKKIENLKQVETEVKKLLKNIKAFENMSEVMTRRENLEIEAIWAHIIVIEQEMNEKQQFIDERTEEIQSFTDLIKNKDEHKQTLTDNVKQIRQQLLEIRNEEESNQNLINTARNRLHAIRETVAGKMNEMTSIQTLIKRKEADKKNIENEINNSSEHQSNRVKMLQERDQKILTAEDRNKKVTNLLKTTENDLNQIRNTLKMRQEEQNNLNTELYEVSSKVKQRQAKIRSLKMNENNSISVYGEKMQKILQCVDVYKEQFKKLPKGPLGLYIKLKDKQWSLAIEDFIGTVTLMSFCVDNQNDAKILNQIFNQVCGNTPKPTIINSKFYDKVHNYSNQKVRAVNGCKAMIDALIIKDPVIINCLIDQLSIENILLISTNELARHLMSNKSRVPKNCQRAITLNGDQFYPDPNYRSYSCRNKNPKYLQVSALEVIGIYEDELKALKNNETVVTKQLQDISTDVIHLTNEAQNLKKKILILEAGQQKIQREMNDLKLLNIPPEPNIEILSEEMKEIGKIIESKLNLHKKLVEEIQSIKVNMKEVEDEYRELKNNSKSLESRIKPLIDQINDSESKLKNIHLNKKCHEYKIRQCKEKITGKIKEREKLENVLKEKLDFANGLGPRVQTDRPIETILEELNEVSQQLKDTKAALGDRVAISELYFLMQDKYDKTNQEVKTVEHCLNELINTVESRGRYYHKLTEWVGIRVREMFGAVLTLRQFKGTIDINHEKQSLNLVVYPQHGSAKGTGQTHILSGGERSYSTVAFLHALWQVMEYPFYILDEFDVFMDKVNRRTVMDILLEHAKGHSDLQFIFLTPQDISNIISDKNITIHKLQDPDRSAIKH